MGHNTNNVCMLTMELLFSNQNQQTWWLILDFYGCTDVQTELVLKSTRMPIYKL